MSTVCALRACVHVLLDKHTGQWLTVTDLCMATGAPSIRVRNVAHQLVRDGTAHMGTVNGVEHFGVGVEGSPPAFASLIRS
jgi:hypothetical protein